MQTFGGRFSVIGCHAVVDSGGVYDEQKNSSADTHHPQAQGQEVVRPP